MKKLLISICLGSSLVLNACATTNVVNIGTVTTNIVSRMFVGQIDTNSFSLTNIFGASSFGPQFSTNGGQLQLVVGVQTTNAYAYGEFGVSHISGLNFSSTVTLSTNAGSTASYTMNANPSDTAFTVNLTPSGTGIANGEVFTKTFVSQYSVAPTVVFSAGPVNTNGLGKLAYVSSITTTNLTFSASGLSSGTTYTWTFHIIQ